MITTSNVEYPISRVFLAGFLSPFRFSSAMVLPSRSLLSEYIPTVSEIPTIQ